jgi:hypothetical protein
MGQQQQSDRNPSARILFRSFAVWDCRPEKVNVRYQDFKHKKTGDALWVSDNRSPPWVVAELAAMAPRTVPLDTFSWNRKLS